ncbi:LysR family transcriptional regulator [Achromobacter denitrificans]|uniref:LysR family transcriptional regulator n=1 Tax=Achromobacter denitrificans TaxID=32002 RepID=UPI000B496232|nr:LysR family transcriptional regulator [Achromobacter denitrificans]MDF3860191.1 LysR family transcriptional regulator [Achromobacter denitrificans]CAB3812671.1 HTH-type transcriptional regulator DmlR [Achromobacter denitrificans]
MQFDDVRIFAAAVDAGSFTAAAEKLLLSKQFVSRRIASLEASLGVQLLVRNTRKLTVTESGKEFYAHAERILEDIARAEQAMARRRTELHGTLRISTPMSFGLRHLSPLISEFLTRHPALQLQVILNDRHVDLVGESFDMALRIGEMPDSTLIAKRLGELRMAVCCSPSYRRQHGLPQTPADLPRHDCLLYGREARNGWPFTVDGEPRMIDVRGPLLSNNGEIVRDAAIAGLGIALLPRFIVGEALRSGELVAVLEGHAPRPLPVSAVYPQHRQQSTNLCAFVEFLEARYARMMERLEA